MNKKILFVTLSNIGDVILSIPTLLFLSKKYPEAKFDIVCDKRSYLLLSNFPFINKFLFREKKQKIKNTLSLIIKLRETNYDIAVDLRTDLLLYFVKAKKKYWKVKNNNKHSAVNHFLSLKESLNCMPKPKLIIPKKIEKNFFNFSFLNRERVLSIGLGSNDPDKIWPTKKYIELIEYLKKDFSFIILLGDKSDRTKANIFSKTVSVDVKNFCGETNLIETAFLLKKSSLYIGNDSGLGHIASAVNTKSFTIFGKGDPNRYKPFGDSAFFYQDPKKNIFNVSPRLIYKKIKLFGLLNEKN